MTSPYLCNRGENLWTVGRRVFGFLTVNGIRSGPFHSEYTLSLAGQQGKLVVRIPYATQFKTDDEQNAFNERIHQWVSVGLHPHLEACHGLIPGDASAYFLEFTEGSPLTSWVRSGQSSLRSILSILIQICHGVEYLHSHGIAHDELLPDSIIITGASLAKIKEVVRPLVPGQGQSQQDAIRSLGDLLRLMLFAGFGPGQADEIISDAVFPDHLQGYTDFLRPVLEKCLHPSGRGYPDVSSLRQELNRVYRLVYGLDCPYHTLEIDLRAESLNNQAVVCFAIGRSRDGFVKLQQALHLHDRLPEAVYNLILIKLLSGMFPLERVLLMIDSALVDSSVTHHLALLKSQVNKMMREKDRKKVPLPSFVLCSSPQSLSFYRKARQGEKKRREIENHLNRLRYEACLKSLLTAWRTNRFAKDAFLASIYDRLLAKSDKGDIAWVQRYAILSGLGSEVEHLAYLPGSRKIVEAGGDDRVRIRNFGRGGKVSFINTGGQAITALAVSPDGRIIAVGTEEGEVVFWQSRAGHSQLWRAQLHHGRINALSFSSDGRFFASGGTDGTMVIRTISTGRDKVVNAWDDQQLVCLSFVADGLELVTANDGGEIKIWAARGKKCLQQFSAHAGSVASLSVAPQGGFFVSTGGEEIKVWDIHTGRCLQELPGHSGGKTLVLLLDDHRHLVSAGMDDMIRIRDLVSGEVVAILDGRGDGIRCLAKGSQPHFFFVGQQGGALLVWKIIYHLNFS